MAIEKRIKKRNKLFLSIIILFLVTQAFIVGLNVSRVFFAGRDSYPAAPGEQMAGDIFFTGNTVGKTGVTGCSRVGSITRRASILNRFGGDYLYLDFGNLFSDSPRVNQAAVPLLLNIHRYMGLAVLNMTKQDLLHLVESSHEICGIGVVSANLRIDGPPGHRKWVSTQPYKLVPMRLKNSKGMREITVAVTGITNDNRKLHRGLCRFTVQDAASSLKKIMNELETADLKILLFNESFLKLRKILSSRDHCFDLVIASGSLPGQVDKLVYVNNIPVVFSDEEGRILGHVRVYERNNEYSFELDSYMPGLGAPRDRYVRSVLKQISQRM